MTHFLSFRSNLLLHLDAAKLVHIVQARLCVRGPELIKPRAELTVDLVLDLNEPRGLTLVAQRVRRLHQARRALLRGLVDTPQLIVKRLAVRREQRREPPTPPRYLRLVRNPPRRNALLHRVTLHRRHRAVLPARHHVDLGLLKDVRLRILPRLLRLARAIVRCLHDIEGRAVRKPRAATIT